MLDTSLITEEKKIELFIKKIINSETISIDIEFMRRNTFFPEPCVIQLSNGNMHACIDLTLEVDYKILFKSIFKEDKKIIIHSCRQDLEILYMILGFIPQNIFDTQFAASFLGFKYQIGYAELIKEIYNIDIDKTEKMTDWRKRPLSKKQINYALNDVKHLNRLSKDLTDKLIETKKIDYFNEEFTNYLNDIDWSPNINDAWKKIKAINSLNKKTREVAQILSIWRERKAIDKNIPRNWIMNEKEIIEISKNYVSSKKISFHNKNIDSIEILKIIEKNKNLDKKNYNEENKKPYNSNYKKIADDLYEYFKSVSLKNNISYQIVSPKKMIINYLKNQDNNSRLINGWRREIIDINKISKITNPLFNPD